METKDILKEAPTTELDLSKIHGRAVIELTDINTGETTRIEETNMVTNAVRNILKENVMGLIDIKKITPINKLFGGVMCFGSTFTEDADNIIPVNDEINPLRAHAGQTAHSSASPLRGNPNGAESGEITNGYRFVWDFQTNQGNGTIGSVCLVPSETGDIGLKPFDASLGYGVTIGSEVITTQEYRDVTREVALKFPRSFNQETGEGIALWRSGSTFEEIKVKFNTTKFYLNASANVPEELSNRTATLTRSFDVQYSAVVEDEENYYIIEITSDGTSKVYMDIVNKETFTATSGTFTATGCNFHRFRNNNFIAGLSISPYVGYDGTYLYLLSSTDYTFYKIEMANKANITTLESNMTSRPVYNNNRLTGIIAINSELLIGDNFIINGGHVYKTAAFYRGNKSGYGLNSPIGDTYPNKYITVANTPSSSSPATIPQEIVILPTFCTICNLESSVTKSSSQTMKIVYEITQET